MAKTAKSPQQIRAQLVRFQSKAKAIIDKIADERDKLRALVDDCQDIIATIDDAEQEWDYVLDKLSALL